MQAVLSKVGNPSGFPSLSLRTSVSKSTVVPFRGGIWTCYILVDTKLREFYIVNLTKECLNVKKIVNDAYSQKSLKLNQFNMLFPVINQLNRSPEI